MRSVLIVVELPSGSPRPPSSLGCYVINVGRETRLAIGCIQIQRGTRIMARAAASGERRNCNGDTLPGRKN